MAIFAYVDASPQCGPNDLNTIIKSVLAIGPYGVKKITFLRKFSSVLVSFCLRKKMRSVNISGNKAEISLLITPFCSILALLGLNQVIKSF